VECSVGKRKAKNSALRPFDSRSRVADGAAGYRMNNLVVAGPGFALAHPSAEPPETPKRNGNCNEKPTTGCKRRPKAQVTRGGAGGARTHDRQIMRKPAWPPSMLAESLHQPLVLVSRDLLGSGRTGQDGAGRDGCSHFVPIGSHGYGSPTCADWLVPAAEQQPKRGLTR
jgi:hypothetical protein